MASFSHAEFTSSNLPVSETLVRLLLMSSYKKLKFHHVCGARLKSYAATFA